MAIRKLFGTPTLDACIFWSEIANEGGWRVQYNRTLDSYSPLKPFRLLDPDSYLWASADSAEELAEAMPKLIEEFSQKSPLFTREDVVRTLMTISKVLWQSALASKGIAPAACKRITG